ncbi:MAG: PAS domain S-box protein [Verrucomicrobiales bacterium]|nr:PAS domain S-box protein [Verrucomicrobiales bacterium]
MDDRAAPDLNPDPTAPPQSDSGTYSLDAQGHFLAVSPDAARLLGHPRDVLMGMCILDLLPPEERARTANRLAHRFHTGGLGDPFVVDIIDPAGHRRTIEVTSTVVDSGGPAPRLDGFARDISDRKRAESLLRQLASLTVQGTGDTFFPTIARTLAESLPSRNVWIGVLHPAATPQLRPVAVWSGGAAVTNPTPVTLPSAATETIATPVTCVGQQACQSHPWITQLIGPDTESFVGLSLKGVDDRTLGFLAVGGAGKFQPSPAQQDVLRILAARAGAELDRLRATQALRISEERFRHLAEQARDVLWVMELPSLQLTYLSPSFADLTGVPVAAKMLRVRSVLSVIHRQDRRRVLETLRDAALGGGGGYAMEYRISSANSEPRWILDQGVVVRDEQGRARRISGVARDITARKQAEIALAAERARFRDLFDNSPDAIFLESFEGVILDVNRAACNLHRLPRAGLVGRHVTELVPENLRAEVQANFQRLSSGEQATSEGFSLRSDGSSVPVELRATRVALAEGRQALLVHVRDTSVRKRSEEFLAGQKRILEWIATGRPVEDVLSELIRVSEARHDGIRCWILWFPDEHAPHPLVLAPTMRPESLPILAGLARTDGRIGPLIASSRGEPAVIRDLFSDFSVAARLEKLERKRWDAAVVVPIVARSGHRLGAFTAFLDAGVQPSGALLDLQRLAASLAGVAIQRHLTDASLREGAERLRRANSALLELARSELIAQGDLGPALQEISTAAARGIGVNRVTVWMFEESDSLLRCISLYESGYAVQDPAVELRVADYPSYFEAVTRDRLVSVTDVETDLRTAELLPSYFRPLSVSSILDAGIRLRGRLVGVICLEHQGPRRNWKSEEELFAGSVADIVALAVQAGERRCIEDALRQSEEAYRSVVAALAEGVMLVKTDGSFVTFNDSAADILGITPEYLASHRLTDADWNTVRLDGTPLPEAEYPPAVTLRTGEPVTDAVMGVRRPDSRLVWLSMNTRPFSRDENGQVTSVVVSFADISRRQQAERALREGHELLQSVSDLQARFIANPDPSGTFNHMLERLVQMTDSTAGLIGEVIPGAGGKLELTVYPDPAAHTAEAPEDPSLRARLADLLFEVMNSAAPVVRTYQEPAPHHDLALPALHLEVLGLPLQHDNKVVGVAALCRPRSSYETGLIRRLEPLLITCANLIGAVRIDRQREHAEARIRQLNAELEQRVEERTADLRSTNEELAEFAYVVTHDLKAPLRGIHQLSEWLSQDHAARLDAEGLRLLGLLRGRVQHLQRMIDGLLACAKVGRTPEAESSVSSLNMIREIASVIAPPANIRIEPAPDLPVIWGNPDRLYQIFQNLLDNAVKYLDKEHGLIRASAQRRRGSWEFRVADNGPGISPRYQEKVFQIFQRLDPMGQIPGVGLGLTLVKRIVETRGGRIWIESTEGEGTTICFTWPDRARQRAVT